jgi:hypothetical protein
MKKTSLLRQEKFLDLKEIPTSEFLFASKNSKF